MELEIMTTTAQTFDEQQHKQNLERLNALINATRQPREGARYVHGWLWGILSVGCACLALFAKNAEAAINILRIAAVLSVPSVIMWLLFFISKRKWDSYRKDITCVRDAYQREMQLPENERSQEHFAELMHLAAMHKEMIMEKRYGKTAAGTGRGVGRTIGRMTAYYVVDSFLDGIFR